MRTKTLLAAAILAAGLASSMAQNVYSLNIVGYANKTLASGLNLVANPFNTGVSNGVNEVIPNLPDNSIVYIFNGFKFVASLYSGGAWFDNDTFASVPVPQLAPGTGAFVGNPGLSTNITYVGQVLPSPGASNTIALPSGLSLIGSALPIGGAVNDTNINLTLVDNIIVFQFNGSGFQASLFSGGAWFDNNTFATVPTPTNTIGNGFFYQNPNTPTNWVQKLPAN